MILLYICAFIPVLVGLFLFIFNKRIVWKEWLAGSAAGFIVAVIFHIIAFAGLTSDVETWSGSVTKVDYSPEWVEKYKEAVYKTETYSTGSGKNRRTHTRRVFSHYRTCHKTYPETWQAHLNYGEENQVINISKEKFDEIKQKFGDEIAKTGNRSCTRGGHISSGDNSIYTVFNKTQWIEPVTKQFYFENRIKAAPTTFSFAKVPTNIAVYTYPENSNIFRSDRLINEPRISHLQFDRMNSRLGPKKWVNVIMINFGSNSSSIAEWQQAKWIGGKKNDLVICYGGGNDPWAKVFGWTEKEDCKRNLETLMVTEVIDNNILAKIEAEILKTYIIKDWTKFDYISIEPRPWVYPTYLIILFITQLLLWIWFHLNEFGQNEVLPYNRYNSINRRYL